MQQGITSETGGKHPFDVDSRVGEICEYVSEQAQITRTCIDETFSRIEVTKLFINLLRHAV